MSTTARKSKRVKKLQAMVTDAELSKIKRLATKDNRSVSSFVRLAVIQAITVDRQ